MKRVGIHTRLLVSRIGNLQFSSIGCTDVVTLTLINHEWHFFNVSSVKCFHLIIKPNVILSCIRVDLNLIQNIPKGKNQVSSKRYSFRFINLVWVGFSQSRFFSVLRDIAEKGLWA